MSQSTKTALAAVAVLLLAGAFWMLLLAPKREKADELAQRAESLQAEVTTEEARASAALQAKRDFPRRYRELVLLGKAVPAEAGTPSLLVQLNGVSAKADTTFESIALKAEGSEAAPAPTEPVPATESAASLAPIGASVGPSGLLVMPYSLGFDGGFFGIADFIHGLDSLVMTRQDEVVAKGRLVTIDSFTLTSSEEGGADGLSATFEVSTYVTPPGEGLTGGAAPTGPVAATAP